MASRKTQAEREATAQRYALALGACTDAELEVLLSDPNQSVRNAAAMNPDASAEILDRFAADRFWSVRVAVAEHPNTARSTLLGLLEAVPARRGVVHHAARERLEREGVRFTGDGNPE